MRTRTSFFFIKVAYRLQTADKGIPSYTNEPSRVGEKYRLLETDPFIARRDKR